MAQLRKRLGIMNEQVEKLLLATSNETFTSIARGVLNDPKAKLAGSQTFSEITTPHNDARTLGIVKVSGSANTPKSGARNWSSVVKVIDLTVPANDAAQWAFPENEPKVYELGLFADDGLPFRPAKCYLTQSTGEGLEILWIEDLSSASQPPWNLYQFIKTAGHLGKFDGYHAVHSTVVPIKVAQDAFHLRWAKPDRASNFAKLLNIKDETATKRIYQNVPVESAIKLAVIYDRALETAKKIPHSLAFGDSHARNMFPVDSETVGIDWATLSNDPIGCDIGVLLGSPVSFTAIESNLIVNHERTIYDSYVAGLESEGWNGNNDHVRLGFFCQFGGYFTAIGASPTIFEAVANDEKLRAHYEKRFSAKFDDIPDQLAEVTALYPHYTEELEKLIDRVENSL